MRIFLREAVRHALGPGKGIEDFIGLASNNPDFPKAIQSVQTLFEFDGSEYWGLDLGGREMSLLEVEALIAELVNAFNDPVTSPVSRRWSTSATRARPPLDVNVYQPQPMPDPPYHGFITRLAKDDINPSLMKPRLPVGWRSACVGRFAKAYGQL